MVNETIFGAMIVSASALVGSANLKEAVSHHVLVVLTAAVALCRRWIVYRILGRALGREAISIALCLRRGFRPDLRCCLWR